ncbi:MAG: GtrA family protein [Patescibacteria group bacterium]
MYQRRDFYLVTLIGFIVGWLVLVPVKNGFGVAFTVPLVVGSVVGFSAFAPLALFLLKLLSRRWRVFEQFGKFAAVGTLNTLLDLSVLNGLIALSGIASGVGFAGFKALSFIVGTTNSYFWNKFWTFESRMPVTAREYLRFATFTLIGTIINVSVASFVVNVVDAPEGMSPKLWANVGALIAVAASFLWNFLSYRLVVFKQPVADNQQLTTPKT